MSARVWVVLPGARWRPRPGRRRATRYELRNGTTLKYNGPNTNYELAPCSGSFTVKACNVTGCSAASAPAWPEAT